MDKRIVSLKAGNKPIGNVLLSYILDPFLLKKGETISNSHTNHWESVQIATTFLEMGYDVDVIHYDNQSFVPSKEYDIFVAARTNFQRIGHALNNRCIKIVHLDTAHWLFNNSAEYRRCLEVQRKKGVTLKSFRPVDPNWAIEYADCATILGNDFTIETYCHAQKPMYRVPLPAITSYSYLERDFASCRKNFLWFGSKGLVHKGLNLVLEAFAELKDFHLTVCGPIQEETDFEKAFYQELYETPNIKTVGWLDVTSPDFLEIARSCIGFVYPSCSEGLAGSVVTCMHAGLIPVVSYQSGVDVAENAGIILNDCTIDGIKTALTKVSNLSTSQLKNMSRQSWKYARENHTKEKFARDYKNAIQTILNDHQLQPSQTISLLSDQYLKTTD